MDPARLDGHRSEEGLDRRRVLQPGVGAAGRLLCRVEREDDVAAVTDRYVTCDGTEVNGTG